MSFDVVMPYRPDGGQRDRIFAWTKDWWEYYLDEPVYSSDSDGEVFNRSQARNRAAAQGDGEVIIFVDADTVLGHHESINTGAWAVYKKQCPWVIPYKTYFNLSQEYTETALDEDPMWFKGRHHRDFSYEHELVSWAGVLMVRREDFEKVGGYDERFVGWGHEDVAFRIKLDVEIGGHVRTPGEAFHLWHPIDPGQTFGSSDELRNRRLFNRDYKLKYGWKDERINR